MTANNNRYNRHLKTNNQYWNSNLLLWYQLTHYVDISDILDKIKIDYYC